MVIVMATGMALVVIVMLRLVVFRLVMMVGVMVVIFHGSRGRNRWITLNIRPEPLGRPDRSAGTRSRKMSCLSEASLTFFQRAEA